MAKKVIPQIVTYTCDKCGVKLDDREEIYNEVKFHRYGTFDPVCVKQFCHSCMVNIMDWTVTRDEQTRNSL